MINDDKNLEHYFELRKVERNLQYCYFIIIMFLFLIFVLTFSCNDWKNKAEAFEKANKILIQDNESLVRDKKSLEHVVQALSK